MRVRRLISILAVGLLASATVIAAPPKKAPAKPAPKDAPKDAPKPAGGATGAGSGSAAGGGSGSAVDMPEDAPPKDMEGKDENPGAPKGATVEANTEVRVVAPPPKIKRGAYPIEEVQRPITMPRNMSEVSLGPHAQLSPYFGADALRARYGVTDKAQIGVTYVFAGIYDDPATVTDDSLGLHAGKAVGVDLTVMLKTWAAVRVAVPMYISPFALAVQLGAPLKFTFGDKFAIGGFDDLLTIRLKGFPPTFYQEFYNAAAADTLQMSSTVQSRGSLRFSTFGIYQYKPKTALVGRLGVNADDFSTTKTGGVGTGLTTFARIGFDYTWKTYLDLGLSLGFDDLAHGGSFGPAGLLNFRI